MDEPDVDETFVNELVKSEVTKDGFFIVTDVKLGQDANAFLPIVSTFVGMDMDARSEHPMNAKSPILIKLSEKVIDVKLEQFSNAPNPMVSPSIEIEDREVQFLNELVPIVAIELEMEMDVKLEQPSNALFPMDVTDDGIVMDDKLLQ
jgi:hypothetical protein